MSLLHRYPDEAALETRDEGLRREVLEEPPKLERWDLVESRWNLGSVLVVLAGAALAVLGLVAAARTGLNETWYRPVEEVAGLRHSPLLAAVEASVGVVLVIAGLAGARGLAAFVCIVGAIAAGVAALEPELVAEELAMERWWAVTLAAAGAGLAVLSMVPWPHFVERLYTRAAGAAPSAVPGANAWPDQRPITRSTTAGGTRNPPSRSSESSSRWDGRTPRRWS
jgi:hypothetical protein